MVAMFVNGLGRKKAVFIEDLP